MRSLLFLAALLALAAPALASLGDNGMETYSGRKRAPNTVVFGNQMVIDLAVQSSVGFAAELLKGTFKPTPNQPATEKKEITLECLNSVAPPPLNWKMWCPSDAKIIQWNDNSGALHRQITVRPQAGMTSTMAIWWISSHLAGIMPPVTEFEGNKYYYYHLWHPLDHVESAWSFGPKNPLTQQGMPIYAYIHERYRPLENSKSGRNYETNGWFFADDSIMNLMKNRFVITMPLMGIPTLTMIIEFNDTPEGLVMDIEIIAGAPAKGYDERSPLRGYPMAAGLNEMAMAPTFAGKIGGGFDWNEAFDAITRHAIEEFTNIQFFVPYFWNKYTALGKAGVNWIPTLGTWLQNNKMQLNPDARSISFYHMLSAVSNSLVNKENTTFAAAVDAAVKKFNGTYNAATDAASAAVVAKSQVYVQPSNAVTRANFENNKASGAHPEAINIYPGVAKNGSVSGVTFNQGNAAKPLAGLQSILSRAFLKEGNNGTVRTFTLNFPGMSKGGNHTIGK